jgi:hypothetical protein
MRSKLYLAVALAALGASVVAATASAGSGSLLGVGESGVQIDLPDGQSLEEVEVVPQCSNTSDDDGDGLTDLDDPDCTGPLDATESGSGAPPPPTPPETPDQGGSTGGATGSGNGVGGGSIGATGGGGRG